MRIHFFAALFCCLHLVQGSGFKDLVAASPPFLEDGISYRSLPRWERLSDGDSSDTGETHFQHTEGANPVSLRQAAPSRGRGENVGRFECIDPSFLWKEVPVGRRLGSQSGVKDDVRLSVFPSSLVSTHFTAVNVSDFVSSERV